MENNGLIIKKINWFSISLAIFIPMLMLVWGGIYFGHTKLYWQDGVTFLIFYQISLFGISVGLHRYFAHKSFQVSDTVESILFIFASSALQFSPLYWAGFHRKHHRYSDTENDSHSPWASNFHYKSRWLTWIHSHFLWSFRFDFKACANEYCKDLINKKNIQFLHRIHFFSGISFIILAGLFEACLMRSFVGFYRGLYFGGILRLFVLHNNIFFLNSFFGHGAGYRRFELSDKSTNSRLMFPLLLGEAWHNNHHARPFSACTQVAWYEFDPHFTILKGLKYLGIVEKFKD